MLEGPDLAGKTTLAKQLKRMIKNSEIVHRGPPTGTAAEEYITPLWDMYDRQGAYILDRWHWGEEIYGPLLRGRSIFTYEQFINCEASCDHLGVTRVLLLPAMSVLKERFEKHGDDLVSFTQLMDIAGQYQRIQLSDRHTVDKIFTTVPTKHEVATLVVEALHRAQEHGWKV